MEKLKQLNFYKVCLIAIFILALSGMFMLYTYHLDHPDTGLFCDEADIGINALCLSKNLRDINNNLLPLYFPGFGWTAFKNPVYIYFTAGIVKIFGLSVYTTRILAVISTILAVFFLVLLVRKLYNTPAGILSGVFLALSPGFFHMSRIAFELNTFNCCFLGFLYFTINYLESRRKIFLIFSLILLTLAWYSYIPSKIYMVFTFILFGIFALYKKKEQAKEFILNNKKVFIIAVVAISFLYIFPDMILQQFNPRAKDLQIIGKSLENFENSNFITAIKINEPDTYNNLEKLPPPVVQLYLSINNYLNAYSYKFLFQEGDAFFRHIVPKKGPLSIPFIVFIPLGLVFIIKYIKNYQNKFIAAAFITRGIPSALVFTDPSLTHNIIMYPVFAVLGGLGAVWVVSFISFKKLWLSILLYLAIIVIFAYPFQVYLKEYYGEYRIQNQYDWQIYRDRILKYFHDNKNKYKNMYVTGQLQEIAFHMAFYGASKYDFDIQEFQKNRKMPFGIKNLDHFMGYKNIQFDSVREYYGKNALLMVNPEYEMPECKPVYVLKYKNGTPFAKFCAF